MIDLYDTEIEAAHKLLTSLQEDAKVGSRDLGKFDQEIKERFHQIGLEVDVKWWHTNVEGVKSPDIEIIGRVDRRHEFDHEQLKHEVVNDVLELGTGGVIKVKPEDVLAAKQYEQSHKKAHGGGSCDGDHKH